MRRGFTLVELSVVLVIVGILLGGIVKGMSMVENARLKRIKQDIDGIVTAVNLYMDQYGALPGDDSVNRTALAPQCTGGNADGKLNNNALEYLCFWQTMIGAGYMSGDNNGTISQVRKKSPYGTPYNVFYVSTDNRNGNAIVVNNVPSDVIQALDERYDDGNPATGDIIVLDENNDIDAAITNQKTPVASYPNPVEDLDLLWYAL